MKFFFRLLRNNFSNDWQQKFIQGISVIRSNGGRLLFMAFMTYALGWGGLSIQIGVSPNSGDVVTAGFGDLFFIKDEEPANLATAPRANNFSNMPWVESTTLSGAALTKLHKQQTYIQQFALAAKNEMQQFGVPASITLAQGLLESNAGDSRLCTENNNHFGIKCFSKTCQRGHCANFTDDSHKDFFRIYTDAADSYRAHSLFLRNKSRYKALFQLNPKDYKSWAKGLQQAGYATDPHYAEKLISLIEKLELYRFDE